VLTFEVTGNGVGIDHPTRPRAIAETAQRPHRAMAPRKHARARADRLSPQDRSEIARAAAEARWGVSIRQATHSGDLEVGGRIIQCAVLDDGVRVVNQSMLLTALGRNSRPKRDDTARLLSAAHLQPFISPALVEALKKPHLL
jgi:hypothetical protein